MSSLFLLLSRQVGAAAAAVACRKSRGAPRPSELGRSQTERMLSILCCVPAYAWGIRAARPALRVRANLDDDPGIRLVPPREWSTPKPAGWTRFVCFSDTHGLHDQIPSGHQPAGDVLLHAGDFTCIGRHEQVESFGLWTAGYPCTDKVVIAGNQDSTFDEQYYTARGAERHGERPYDCTLARGLLAGTGCTYLQDELVEVKQPSL